MSTDRGVGLREGRVALITGGGAGIGEAIARAYAGAAREAVADRRERVEVDAMVQDLAGEALQAVDDSSEPVLAVCEPRIARGDHDPPRKQPGC